MSGRQVGELAAWAEGLRWSAVPEETRGALRRTLANLLAVAAGGAAMPESAALRAAWAPQPGESTLLGEGKRTSVESATWLNSVAAVFHERDEGNRHAKGHPGAQTAFAVLALAEERGIAGERLWTALLSGYEIAARVGRATVFDARVHTHGPLGAVGAAAGCALLLGGSEAEIAAAIDAGAAMAPATSWAAVHGESGVRDQWVGQGAVAGIAAARYALAGAFGTAHGLDETLGGTLGVVDSGDLVAGLGSDYLIDSGYLKQHSSCAYTHGAVDAALDARAQILAAGRSVSEIVGVRADVVSSAAPFSRRTWSTRMGAYFSVPFAVSSALLHGDVAATRAQRATAAQRALAARVTVRDATAQLRPPSPTSRPARVEVEVRGGARFVGSVPHPLGDAADSPFPAHRERELLAEAAAPALRTDRDVAAAVAALFADGPAAVRTCFSLINPHVEGVLP